MDDSDTDLLIVQLQRGTSHSWAGGCQGCGDSMMDEAATKIEELQAALSQAAETARREAYEEAAKVPAQSTNEGMANVPCRFGCKAATGIYYVPKGCSCWTDPVQALCEQHAIKAQSEGPITLIARVGRGLDDAW